MKHLAYQYLVAPVAPSDIYIHRLCQIWLLLLQDTSVCSGGGASCHRDGGPLLFLPDDLLSKVRLSHLRLESLSNPDYYLVENLSK